MADTMLQQCKAVVNLCVLTIEIERMLFSEVCILGDAELHVNLMTTNMVNWHQLRRASITSAIPQKGLCKSVGVCGLSKSIQAFQN